MLVSNIQQQLISRKDELTLTMDLSQEHLGTPWIEGVPVADYSLIHELTNEVTKNPEKLYNCGWISNKGMRKGLHLIYVCDMYSIKTIYHH